jgi:hypothetical protein
LAGEDPVPGDPDQVERIAKRYSDMAEELTRQAGNLRKLATTEGWDADAGRTFAESAGDLAGKLAKTHGRYAAVASSLKAWAPELHHAQQQADDALIKAKQAQATIDANKPPDQPPAGHAGQTDHPPTPEEVAADRRRQTAYDDGIGSLEAARKQLHDATDHRDYHAGRAGHAIRDAIDDDGLKDSRWDKFKNWVHEHAKDIKAIADVCSWIATALSVVAIVISFIPVLNFLTPVLLLAAGIFTGVALICHTLLALSGDGSWVDVGLDVFAIATLGYGRAASAGLKGASSATRLAGARAARKGAEKAVRAASRDQITAASRVLTRRGATAAAKRAAQAELQTIKQAATRGGRVASRAITDVKPSVKLSGLRYLDGGVGALVDDANRIVAQTGNAAKVVAKADVLTQAANKARIAALSAVSVDLADKSTTFDVPFTEKKIDLTGPLPDKPSLFEPIKPFFTREVGSTW